MVSFEFRAPSFEFRAPGRRRQGYCPVPEIRACFVAIKMDRLEKQPTDQWRNIHVFRGQDTSFTLAFRRPVLLIAVCLSSFACKFCGSRRKRVQPVNAAAGSSLASAWLANPPGSRVLGGGEGKSADASRTSAEFSPWSCIRPAKLVRLCCSTLSFVACHEEARLLSSVK